MSAEGPRFPLESKSFENKDKKDKPSKKGNNVRVPSSLISFENKPKPPATGELNPIEKALAELAAKRAAKSEKKAETEEKPKPDAPELTEVKLMPMADVLTEEKSPAEKELSPEPKPKEDKAYEALPSYEPEPVEFSGGEVIVHLNGDTPVAERVIPLHAEETSEGEPEPTEELHPASELQLPVASETQSDEESVPTAGSGGETPPPEPPERPTPSFEQPPEQPQPTFEYAQPSPEDIYQQHFGTNPNTAPAATGDEKAATQQELEDARYYARRAGQNSGLVTGLFVGGLYEHFKHKRREKKAEKRFKTQTKELEQERKASYFNLQEQGKQSNEYDRQYNALEKRLEHAINAEKLSPQTAERPQLEEGEQLTVPADHRLETSAWHTIEVDAKTGRAVENPAFEYGHEYYQERSHENGPAEARDMAAGGVALAAAAGGTNTPTPVPPPAIPNATVQGPPADDSAQKPSSRFASTDSAKPTETTQPTAPIWPWLVALVVIVIILLFLLG